MKRKERIPLRNISSHETVFGGGYLVIFLKFSLSYSRVLSSFGFARRIIKRKPRARRLNTMPPQKMLNVSLQRFESYTCCTSHLCPLTVQPDVQDLHAMWQ